MTPMILIGIGGSLLLGIILGYIFRYILSRTKVDSAELKAQQIINEAQSKVEILHKDAQLDIREMKDKMKHDFENSTASRKREVEEKEKRLMQIQENMDRKLGILDRKDRECQDKERRISAREKQLEHDAQAIQKQRDEQKNMLERLAGLNKEEAKSLLLKRIESETRAEQAGIIRRVEAETKDMAQKKAKDILSIAIQRVAAEHTSEITISSVHIPSDEMKGRIIGREGRNIRAFEQSCGVDVIVDDTPETITISAFDGVRREVARISMERLIADGRIHPARIEEVVNKVKKEVEMKLKEIGEKALIEVGVRGIHPEIVKLLGKLKFRTSYGQNQLQHTMEVVWIAAAIAGELGADIEFVKKAALLHDIGKAIDHDVEGTHHQISADIAKKYNADPKMVNAIISHHEGIEEPKSVEAFIIAAADAVSAARPGARRENLENYIKRLEKLEKIAMSFNGVSNAYAIQAGREVRVLVEPDEVDDKASIFIAREIAKKIESDVEYPGQVKIMVIREVRAMDVAK
ncbi:MAG: ribonuclease Y [bacterium]